MNNCLLMGEVVQPPQLRYTSDNQTPIAEFVLQIPPVKAGDSPAQLKVIGWGNLGQDIQSKYRLGDRLVVEGRLSMNTVTRPEGFKEKRAELTAQRVYSVGELGTVSLGEGAPVNSVAPVPVVPGGMPPGGTPAAPGMPPVAAPAAAPPEDTSYDDIPF